MSLARFFGTIAFLLSLVSGAAQAEVVKYQFTGTVTDGAPMAVLTGTQIVGTFAYDTDLPPELDSPVQATYRIPPPLSISANVGGHSISSGSLIIDVFSHMQSSVEDMMWITGIEVAIDGTYFPSGTLGLVLASAPGNDKALKGTRLPHSLKLKRFDADPVYVYGVLQMNGGPNGGLLQFSIDSLVRMPPDR